MGSGPLAGLEADAPGLAAALGRLRAEDALGQLVERRGRMAELATEAGDVKLDWVDGVAISGGLQRAPTKETATALPARPSDAPMRWTGQKGCRYIPPAIAATTRRRRIPRKFDFRSRVGARTFAWPRGEASMEKPRTT